MPIQTLFETGNDIISQSRATVIKSVSLLRNAEPSLRTALINHLRPIHVMPGECLFTEGDVSREFFILLKGTVECSVANPAPILRGFTTASTELFEALQGLRVDATNQPPLRHPLHSPPLVPISRPISSRPTNSSGSDDDSEAESIESINDEEELFPVRPLHRAASFRLASELPFSTDTASAEFFTSGVTYTQKVPFSAPRFITHVYTGGNTFGAEGIFHGKSMARAYSCRASTPCDILVISSTDLLSLPFPEFIADLKSTSRVVVEQVIMSKRAIATAAKDVTGNNSASIHPATEINLEVFPHISDLLYGVTASSYIATNILTTLYVNDSSAPSNSLPVSLFFNADNIHSMNLHRTLRPIQCERQFYPNSSFFMITLSNVFGLALIPTSPAEEPKPSSIFLPEVEAVEDERALLARAVFSPSSFFKIRWDCLVMFCVIVCAIEIPYEIGFLNDVSTELTILNNCINFVFILDMLLTFRFGYANDNLIITTPWRIVS